MSEGLALSSLFQVRAGVPPGSILAPVLYSVYTSGILQHPFTDLAFFAGDKAIRSTHLNPITDSSLLKEHHTI